jgi:exonuclease V gamma subunit
MHSHKKSTGIEWSSRNSVGEAYTSKQYLKFYAKLELKHHSTLFYDTYIRGSIYDKYLIDNKLLRVETTIKNKAHWKTYNLEISTLKDLLDIDLSKNRTLITRPINYYMTGIKFIKTRTDLTASERAYLYMINSKKMVVVKLKQ